MDSVKSEQEGRGREGEERNKKNEGTIEEERGRVMCSRPEFNRYSKA